MPQYKLLIQRYPYGGVEASECVSWLMATYHRAANDPRFSEVRSAWVNDTPITMTRNQSFAAAKRAGFDFMLIVDSDMAPDHELRNGDRTQVPFFDAAVDYALKSPKPCIIAAPYVGPPPLENVYVFRWANRGNSRHPRAANARLDQYTREEAALLAGIQEVGALPTGLMLIDLRVLDVLPQPYTYYEFARGGAAECPACHQKARGPEDEKASTEDVTFTRDAGMLGVPILCAWSSWAGHVKRYIAGKPRAYTTDFVAHKMREAISRRVFSDDQLVQVEMDPELERLVAERGNNGFGGPVVGAEAHPLDMTAEFLAGMQVPPGKVIQMPAASVVEIDREAFLRPERGVVPSQPAPPAAADPTGWAEFTGYVPPAGEPVRLAEHTLKLTPVFAEQLQQPYAAPPAPAPASPPGLDPGFASLVNQTYTPAPGLRDNFTGPTEGAVDGAAPPPDGTVYPWQLPVPADQNNIGGVPLG